MLRVSVQGFGGKLCVQGQGSTAGNDHKISRCRLPMVKPAKSVCYSWGTIINYEEPSRKVHGQSNMNLGHNGSSRLPKNFN